MLKFLQGFWEIARFRSGPESLPASVFLAQLTFAAYIGIQLPLLFIQTGAGMRPLVSGFADALVLTAFTWTLLRLTGKSSRFIQTVTALYGTGVIISLVAFPVGALVLGSGSGNVPLLAALALLGILIWSVLVAGHIFSRAISRTMVEGVVISLVYFVLNYQIIQMLLNFGQSAAQTG